RQSLQEAVMRFRKLSEASPNAIILVNKKTGVIRDVNQVAKELLDMERKDIIGKDYLDFHPKDVREEIKGILSQPESEESSYSRELEIKNSNDKKIPVKMRTSSLVLGDEEIIYFVLNDISKRKKAEEREEFLHSLLRHDLRNKIHISKGNLDLLKESGLPEEKKEYLDDALESYEEGMDIIEKVRDLKKLGKDEVKEVSIGGGILRRSVDQYRSEAKSKDIEIVLDMNDVTAKVKGGELLPEVFSNLISNSIKHSYGDKIVVSVEEDEDEVICTVEDNGDGIPPEKKDEIIEKGFTTVNSSSGLGLYLVKDIVSHYGGCVEVNDSALGGARFDVHLQKV
ncbi:MAG: ATP-binding protein, partial [Thermoplasmata archaeon]